MARIVDRVDNGVSGPPAVLSLPIEHAFVKGEAKFCCSFCRCGLRSMLGLELCGFPFRRGVFELDRPAPPPVVLLDAAWWRLGFCPHEEEVCSLSGRCE